MFDSRLKGQYFTGTQAKVYINDVPIADIVEIGGVYNQDQVPIYGYASHHFDSVVPGRAMAMGSFSINYIFNGYLLAHINKGAALKEKQKTADEYKDARLATTQDIVIKPENVKGNGYYKELNDLLENKDMLDDQLFSSDEAIKAFRQAYWDGPTKSQPIHPEFVGPLTIKIRDFHIGSLANSNDYEEKIFKDVFINKKSSGREPSASPTTEVYEFIAKAII